MRREGTMSEAFDPFQNQSHGNAAAGEPDKGPGGRLVGGFVLAFILCVGGSFLSGPKGPQGPQAPDRPDVQWKKDWEEMKERMKNSAGKPVFPPLKAEEQVEALRASARGRLRLLEEQLKNLPPVDSLERQELEQRIEVVREIEARLNRTTPVEREEEQLKNLPPVDSTERQELEQRIQVLRAIEARLKGTTPVERE